MATRYRITLKNAEQLGASQPNIVYLEFASDGDAEIFGLNLSGTAIIGGGITTARNVSVDKELSTNYALPYPAGTEYSGRAALGDASGYRMNMPFDNVPAGFVPVTRAAALIASGILMVKGGVVGPAPSYVNPEVFMLQPSV